MNSIHLKCRRVLTLSIILTLSSSSSLSWAINVGSFREHPHIRASENWIREKIARTKVRLPQIEEINRHLEEASRFVKGMEFQRTDISEQVRFTLNQLISYLKTINENYLKERGVSVENFGLLVRSVHTMVKKIYEGEDIETWSLWNGSKLQFLIKNLNTWIEQEKPDLMDLLKMMPRSFEETLEKAKESFSHPPVGPVEDVVVEAPSSAAPPAPFELDPTDSRIIQDETTVPPVLPTEFDKNGNPINSK